MRAQSVHADMSLIEKGPPPERKHGGARPGAGRKPRFSPEAVAQALSEYTSRTQLPSLHNFCATHEGVNEKQIRRWEVRHGCIAIALGVMRHTNELQRGKAA